MNDTSQPVSVSSKERPVFQPILDEHGLPYHPDLQLSWQTYLGNRGPQTPDVLNAYIAAWYAGRAGRSTAETEASPEYVQIGVINDSYEGFTTAEGAEGEPVYKRIAAPKAAGDPVRHPTNEVMDEGEVGSNPCWVTCGNCNHRWIGLYLPMPIREAAKAMRRLTCPKCACTKILCATSTKPRGDSPCSDSGQ